MKYSIKSTQCHHPRLWDGPKVLAGLLFGVRKANLAFREDLHLHIIDFDTLTKECKLDFFVY